MVLAGSTSGGDGSLGGTVAGYPPLASAHTEEIRDGVCKHLTGGGPIVTGKRSQSFELSMRTRTQGIEPLPTLVAG